MVTFLCKEKVGPVSGLTMIRPQSKYLVDCTNREEFDNTSLPRLTSNPPAIWVRYFFEQAMLADPLGAGV